MRDHIQIGDYFPNLPLTDQVSLYDLLKNYLIIAMISTDCAVCLPAFDEIERFATERPDQPLIVLIDTCEQKYHKASQAFSDNVRLYRIDGNTVEREVKGFGFPWAYGINSEGQLISHYFCGNPGNLDTVAAPFRLFHTNVG